MNDNPATARKTKRGNLFQRFSTSLRTQYSVTTILIAVVPLIIVAVALGMLISRQVRAAMMEEAFAHLTSVREAKASEIKSYFEEQKRDITTLAGSTHSLLQDARDIVTSVREVKQGQVEDYFKTTFGVVHAIKDNPTTARAIEELEAAFIAEGRRTGGPQWRAAYEEFDPVFQDANVDFGYDDILLISAAGDVVYSIAGGNEIGENVLLGDLKDSGLGRVFERTMAGEQDVIFEDFAPYAPLDDKPAAFIAGPVENSGGTVVGAIVIQFPPAKFNALMQQQAGLPEGGETFLVAQEPDGRITFRSDRTTVGGGKFVIGYDLSDIAPQAVRNALHGETGIQISTGSTGVYLLASYAPVETGVTGLNWAIVSRIPLESAIIPRVPGEEQDYFQLYAETHGYDDLYLFAPDGQLFYSTAHEPDYQTNLLTGPYRDSNLGQMLAQVIKSQEPDITDFAPYAPSQDEPAAFIAAPVVHHQENGESEVELIVAARLPLDRISAIMQAGTALGKTGEAYLVGQDKMWRSDSRFLDKLGVESTILNTEMPVRTAASLSALAGESGAQIIENYRGQRVLSSWAPLVLDEPDSDDSQGIVWAVIAEIDESEALAPIAATTAFITTLSLGLLGVMAVIAAVVGSWIAGRLVKPIIGLTNSAVAITSGDLDVAIPPVAARNEVGVLANAFATMTTRLRETVGSLRETAARLAERTRELEASQRITFAASERTTPDEMLGLVVDLVRDQFNLYHAQVYIVDEEKQAAVLRQSTGYAGSQLLQKGHQIPLDAPSLVTRAINTGEPVLVDDVNQAEDWLPNPLLPETRSELVVPLKVGDRAIGVLDAQDITPGRFSESTVALFQAMADQIAFLFENNALLERVTAQSEELTVFTTQLRAVSEIARQAGTVLDPAQLLQQTVALMQSRFGLYHAHIYVLDEATGQLTVRAGSGEVGRVLVEEKHAIPLDREQSLVARAARTREPVLIADITLESDFMPNPLLPQTRSELAVPLVAGDRVLGVLDIQDDQAGRFTESDVDTFTTLAGQIAVALQNAELFEAQRADEERFRSIVEYSQAGIIILDSSYHFIYVNDEFCRIVGYEREELIGTDFRNLLDEADVQRAADRYIRRQRGEEVSPRYDFTAVRKDGEKRQLESNVAMFRDSAGNIRSVAQVMDITERKQRETFIQEQNRALADWAGSEKLYSGDLNVALKEITQAAARVLNVKRASVWLYNTSHAKIRCVDLYEPGIGHSHGVELSAEDYPVYFEALEQDRVIAAHNAHTDPQTKEFSEPYLTPLGINSMLDAPIRLGGKMVGVICNEHVGPAREWTLEEQAFAASAADFVASAMEAQARQRFTLQLSTASDIAAQVNAILDPDELLNTVIPLLQERFGLYHAHLYTLEGETLELRAGAGAAGRKMLEQGHSIPLAREDSLVARAARSKKAVLVNDITQSPDFLPNPLLPDTKSEMAVPLVVGDQVLGVFDVQQDETDYFTPADLDVFQTLAGQIATALQNAKLFEEQQRAEAAALESKAQARALLDAIPDMMFRLNGEGVFLDFKAESENDLAVPPETFLGQRIGDILPPAVAQTTMEHLAQVLASGQPVTYEYQLSTMGDEMPHDYESRMVISGKNEVLAIVRDITERKQAEAERERFTLQLSTASDIAAQVNAILDPDELLNAVIPLLQERFGLYHAHVYTLERETLELRAGAGAAGRKMLEQGHSIPLAREDSLVARAARSKKAVLVNDVTQSPDFLPNPLLPDTKSEMAVPLVVGDQVLGVFDVQQDETDYFTPADLDVFQTLAGQIAIALQNAGYVAQIKARLKVGQALTGAQTEDEVLDAMIRVAGFYPQSGTAILLFDREAQEPTLIVQRHADFGANIFFLPEGTRFPASQFPLMQYLTSDSAFVSTNIITDPRVDPRSAETAKQGGYIGVAVIPITAGDEWLGIITALSPQEGYFDEQKLYLYRSLAEQGAAALHTARLYDETQRAAELVREADRRKSEFLADISHELRTPLNSIIGYTELMLMGVSEIDPDTLEDVQAIYDNGQLLLHIINNLLDLAKIEAGRLELGMEKVDIPELLEEVRTGNAGLLVNKPVEILVEAEQDIPPIEADRVRLSQILNNLLGNAIKFTEEGSITLRAFGDDGWVCIEVEDTGAGMSEDDLQKIFERFRRAESSFTRRAEGTGLGLDITRHLVEMHGGTIDVRSKLGAGSTFTVRLPVQQSGD